MYEIWHTILWSQYKAKVFNELYKISIDNGAEIRFFQIAETSGERALLSNVDASIHKYPYTLLFKGSIDSVGKLPLMAKMSKYILKSNAKFTILSGYHTAEYWAQLLILILRGKPRGVFCDSTVNDHPQIWWKSILKRFFFSRCDKIFCYGQRSKEYIMMHGVPEEKIIIRCQAAALPPNYNKDTAISRRQKERSESPRFIYVGRMAPEKNLPVLLDSFNAFRQSNSSATLRMIGNGVLRDQLTDYCVANDIQGVAWVGSLSGEALWSEYLAASAMILPSMSEPWGLVVNEALSFGCPVIVSDKCGCIPELVIDGKTGYAVDPLDAMDISDKMRKSIELLQTDAVSDFCIHLMQEYSPHQAAQQIYDGLAEQYR